MYDFQITLEINVYNLLMEENKESLKEFDEGLNSDLEGALLQTTHLPNLLELAAVIFRLPSKLNHTNSLLTITQAV